MVDFVACVCLLVTVLVLSVVAMAWPEVGLIAGGCVLLVSAFVVMAFPPE